jgi:hypothetical protein
MERDFFLVSNIIFLPLLLACRRERQYVGAQLGISSEPANLKTILLFLANFKSI